MRSASNSLNYASGMTYNALGQLTQMTYGNTVVTHYTYDALNARLKSIQVGSSGSLLNLSYGYDAVGNVKAITDTTNSGQVQTFGYDALDRLIAASTTLTGTGQYVESYQYNPIGNITYTSRLGNYSYSDPLHKHAATAAGSNRYAYDKNGNMITRTEWVSPTLAYTYTQQWNSENRLTVVTATNGITQSVTRFYYDGDGKRVKKTEGVTATVYVGAIYEKNVTTGVTTTYYYAGSQRVAMRQGNVVSYLHGDVRHEVAG